MGLTLGSWLGGRGEVTITPLEAGRAKIFAKFTGLRPHGVYSLFDVNAILVVYHSDGKTHGTSRGAIGVTAHHQLIAKVT